MTSTGLNSSKLGLTGHRGKEGLPPDKSGDGKTEAEENIYLLELIVESVKVEKEGILDEFKTEEEEQPPSSTAVEAGQQPPATAQDAAASESQPPPLQTGTDDAAQSPKARRNADALGTTKVVMKFYEFPAIEITEKEYVTPMESEQSPPLAADVSKVVGFDGGVTTASVEDQTATESQGLADEPSQTSRGARGKQPEEQPVNIKHTTGKSCLFPMKPMKLIDVIKRHPLEIQLSRASGTGPRALPAHIIGQTRIHMDQKFIDVVAQAATPITLPISASIVDSFDLKNVFGDTTATIRLVVRLSCFGSNIFTQFNYVKGAEGFQFKTGTCASESRQQVADNAKKRKELEESRKLTGLAVDVDGDCQPEFIDENIMLGCLSVTPEAKKVDAFKRAVPWRKLKEEVPLPKICGPKNLFAEAQSPVKCPFKKDKVDFQGMFPSLTFKPGVTNNPKPGDPKRQQVIPSGFGNTVPPALQNLMPGQVGTSSGPVEAPPGIKYPCQFGSTWLPEIPPTVATPRNFGCTNIRPGEPAAPGNYVCTSTIDITSTTAGVGCSCPKKPPMAGGTGAPAAAVPPPVRFQPGVANAPAFPRGAAPQKCFQCECGLADRSNKDTATQKPSLEEASKSALGGDPLDRVPCPFFKNEIKGMMQYPQKETMQCPTFMQTSPGAGAWNQQDPSCGLSALATPEQQSLKNLLNRPIMPPVCPSDSAQGVTSLCTCPKVATAQQRPNYGYIKCECSNIMTSVKPIDMPFSCGPPCPAKANTTAGQQTTRVDPVPINLPPPPPECPLAQLLQEAAAAERKQQEPSAAGPPPQQPPTGLQQGGGGASQLAVGVSGGGSNQRVDERSQLMVQSGGKDKLGADTSRDDPKKGAKQKGKKKEVNTNSSQEQTVTTADKLPEAPTTDEAGDTTDEKERGQKRNPEEKAKAMLKEELHTYDEDTSDLGSVEKSAMPKKNKQKKKRGEDQTVQPVGQRTSGLPPFIAEKDADIAYTYTAGMYPGIHVGHKDCVPVYQLVPKNMGWLWNVRDGSGYLRPGRGWRPGSIQTQVMKVIDYVKKSEKENIKPKSRNLGIAKAHSGKLKSQRETGAQQQAPLTDDVSKAAAAMLMGGGDNSATTPAAINTGPTLHLHKTHGVYYVSLYPPKKPSQKQSPTRKGGKKGGGGGGGGEVSEEEKPIQFRIDPKNPDDNDQGLDDIYETDDTSTDSADSYELEFVTPNTMAHRTVKPYKCNMEIQVTENDLFPSGKKGVDIESKTSLGSTQKSALKKSKGKANKRSSKASKGSLGSKGKGKGVKAGKKK